MYMRSLLIIFLLTFNLGYSSEIARIKQAKLDFYANPLTIYYDPNMDMAYSGRFSPGAAEAFSSMMEGSGYPVLLSSLMDKKKALELNDWLYYQLIKQSTDKIFGHRDQSFRTMLDWFLLAKSGYKVKLFYDDKMPYLFVAAEERVYEVPFVQNKDGRFVNISYYSEKPGTAIGKLSEVAANYDPKAKPFQFKMNTLPTLFSPNIVEKKLSFIYNGETIELNVKGDKSFIYFVRRYPKLDLNGYADVPMSQAAYSSFIPAFRELVAGKSEEEAVRMMLSFTRKALVYKTDKEAYHEDNLMFTPEQTLLSPYSDCEDRAVLFSYMVKELLGLKTVFLEYPNHISVAVHFSSRAYGKPVAYNGDYYSVCEPTGPQDDLNIGDYPRSQAHRSFHVYQQ